MELFRNPHVRSILRAYRTRIIVAFVAMTGRGLLGLGVPYFFGSTVGLIAQGAESRRIWTHASALVGVALATAFCQFWMRWLYIGTSRAFEFELRNRVFEHLSKLPFSWFNRARTGDIMSRLTADVEAVRMGVGPGVMHLYQTGIMAAGALTFMLIVSWKLTLLAAVPMTLLLVLCRLLMPSIHNASVRVQEQLSSMSALAQESFSGSRVVKAFAREDYENQRFDSEASRYIDDSMRLAMLRARLHTVIELMAGLVTVFLLYFGGRHVVGEELSYGLFVSFLAYFMMLVWPMIAIGWTLSLFQRSKVALARLDEVFSTHPEIVDGAGTGGEPRGAWSVRGLGFSYEGGEPVLEDVSFELPQGGSLAIVGPTGCGKSTLVALMGRLFDPPPGTVFLDGHDVRDMRLGDLRRSISMVPQETFLFSDSIRANIAYADPDLELEAIIRAAEAAEVHESIEDFPHRYDEVIGERGVTLSGGQKQRVAIARALVHGAPTLVLDDCLSAVDTDTEERILGHLEKAMKGRTTVIIAHRLSSVMHCDEIIVMKEGRIVERGDHDALVAAGGWYADTWKRQLLRRELGAA